MFSGLRDYPDWFPLSRSYKLSFVHETSTLLYNYTGLYRFPIFWKYLSQRLCMSTWKCKSAGGEIWYKLGINSLKKVFIKNSWKGRLTRIYRMRADFESSMVYYSISINHNRRQWQDLKCQVARGKRIKAACALKGLWEKDVKCCKMQSVTRCLLEEI